MNQERTKTSDARRRILETAERLFYAEGIRAVGIDRIIAEAGVAKMSLYNHFSSKDELVLATLAFREEKIDALFSDSLQRHRQAGLDPLAAFFASLRDWFESPGFRGCAFINARVEYCDPRHPAACFSAAHKTRFHAMLNRQIAESAGEAAARTSGPAIALLVEGAIVTAVMEQSPAAADVARDAALALLSVSPVAGKHVA